METEINVLALVKGEEKFIFLFDDANRDATLRQLAHFAADPELDFSWYDAAMLCRKIRDAVPTEDEGREKSTRSGSHPRTPMSDRR